MQKKYVIIEGYQGTWKDTKTQVPPTGKSVIAFKSASAQNQVPGKRHEAMSVQKNTAIKQEKTKS